MTARKGDLHDEHSTYRGLCQYLARRGRLMLKELHLNRRLYWYATGCSKTRYSDTDLPGMQETGTTSGLVRVPHADITILIDWYDTRRCSSIYIIYQGTS
jgi:hypothetical protein